VDLAAESALREESFWLAATATELSSRRGAHQEFATLVPSSGDAYLRCQRLADGDSRVHLDFHVADVVAGTGIALDIGATLTHARDGLSILTSPGGLVFCLVRDQGQSVRPGPARWPGGHTSLLDQMCLDIPRTIYEGECVFWASLTGWERRPGRRPEFSFLERPVDQPLRLLLQSLEDADGSIRAHLDFASSEVAAEVARHVALGAVVIDTFAHWTVLSDPGGLTYCVTGRDPTTGALPPS
jgi:hypothetical protein